MSVVLGLRPNLGNFASWSKAPSSSPLHSLGRVEVPNRLQTTYEPAGVSYLVEQLPYCDLLRLSPFDWMICLVSLTSRPNSWVGKAKFALSLRANFAFFVWSEGEWSPCPLDLFLFCQCYFWVSEKLPLGKVCSLSSKLCLFYLVRVGVVPQPLDLSFLNLTTTTAGKVCFQQQTLPFFIQSNLFESFKVIFTKWQSLMSSQASDFAIFFGSSICGQYYVCSLRRYPPHTLAQTTVRQVALMCPSTLFLMK